MDKTNLGDRMKGYENVNRNYLTKRTPTILRLNGKSFHTFTKGFDKPFDDILIFAMKYTAEYLCASISGCKLAYVQSDEISLLLTDYDNLDTQAWFGKNIQKMVSVSASMATMAFNKYFNSELVCNVRAFKPVYDKLAMFDSRVLNLPKEEVCNYFIWRQQDATRNSIQMVGQSHFSHQQLDGKSCSKIQEILFHEKGLNWNDLDTHKRRGLCITKGYYDEFGLKVNGWSTDMEIPVFTQDRDYIERYIQEAQNDNSYTH